MAKKPIPKPAPPRKSAGLRGVASLVKVQVGPSYIKPGDRLKKPPGKGAKS